MESKMPFYYKANTKSHETARVLRKGQTSAEVLFWYTVKNRKIKGMKFRRQHPIGPFIVDFYCDEAKLVIELDGKIHDLEHIKAYDSSREMHLSSLGLQIMRFTNDQIFNNFDTVIKTVEDYLSGR